MMEVSISATRLSELVGLIYDAAIDPARWPVATEAIRLELNCHNSALGLHRLPSGEVISNVTTNIPEEYLPIMHEPSSDVLGPWGGARVYFALPADKPAALTWVNPDFDAERSANAYVNNFARPQGIIDVLSVNLARDARAFGALSFGRHRSAGPIGAREMAVAELLIPHLQRAATINRMLDIAALAKTTFEATIDTLNVPVVLVGADLRIVHCNPAAAALLDAGDLIRISNGALSAVSTGARGALAVAVERGAKDEGGIGRRGLGIPLRRGDEPAGALHVLPLRSGRLGTDTAAAAAVFVADIDSPFVPPTDIIATLFGLSPAEARVFAHIAQGRGVSDTAAALGIGRATVRTHLARCYDKTGTHRQADLVHIAASLAVPLAA